MSERVIEVYRAMRETNPFAAAALRRAHQRELGEAEQREQLERERVERLTNAELLAEHAAAKGK